MSRTRSIVAVLAVVALALPALFGATAAPDPEEGVGDASAGLLGAELLVDDLGGVLGLLGLEADAIDVGLLEATTFASTRDEPDALATFSPLRLGDERPHDIQAGPGEREAGAAISESTLLADIEVSAADVAAAAGEDGAEAVLDAVAASLDVLGATGLDIAAGEVRSEVTGTGASATQDLVVEDLVVGLGDLLPAELLELLPVEVLLDLLDALPLADVQAALQGAVSDVEDAIDELNAMDLGALNEVDTDLVNELIGLYDLLENLDAGDLLAPGGALLEAITECELDLLDLSVASVATCLEGLIEDLELDVEDLDGLVELLHGLLSTLDGAIDDLLGAIENAVDAITGLALLEAGHLQLDVAAAADSTGGATTLVCELGDLTVLGQSLGDHSCEGGLLDGSADAAVTGAVATIGDLLNALPGVSGAEGVHLALLPSSFEEVETDDDGTVSAAAGAVLLELAVPSVIIDPAAMLDELLALDTLAPTLIASIDGLEDLIDGLVSLLDDAGAGELLASANALAGQIEGLLETVLGELDLLRELPLLDTALATPSLSLVLDPVSEATFTAASADGPGTDEPVTTADPSDAPLPTTGGGIALLGLLVLMGAVGLRRAG